MRWKLLLPLTVLATAINVATISIANLAGPAAHLTPAGRPTTVRLALPLIIALLFNLATIVITSVFVYRHTARRRLLQAIVTVVLTIALTLALLFSLQRFAPVTSIYG